MAASSDEMLLIALAAQRQPTPLRQLMVVRVVRAIGELLFHFGKLNFLGWDEAVQTLAEMALWLLLSSM
jgi:hypothetical protein